jgi:hypothetical protein
MTREKRQLICLIIAIIILVYALSVTAVNNEKLQERIEQLQPKVTTGQYTILHYPPGGWVNAIYITEYYLDGHIIHYKEKGSTEFKPLYFPNILPVDGWIEGEALTEYGIWTSELEGELE